MKNNPEGFDPLYGEERMDTEIPPNTESKEHRMKRLMGFRDFQKRTQEEKLALLGSGERVKALDAITTTTLPSSKKEMKKGVVLEIAEKRLISDEILRAYPLVYIGSGTDLEYTLALGGRITVMVDPILAIPEIRDELIEKVKKLGPGANIQNDTCVFEFDFGHGKERVSVELAAKAYSAENSEYELPDRIGAIVLYASQGPAGRITADDTMMDKMVEGGIIIEDTTVIKIKGGQKETIELGA